MYTTLFDTHIHFFDSVYQKSSFFNTLNLIKIGEERKVGFFCNVGIDLITSKTALTTAQKYHNVFAACGYHPTMVNAWNFNSKKEMINLLKESKIVAIGEIGLDFYHQYTKPKKQKEVLHYQLSLAQKYNKPVLLHIRDAYPETWEIVSQYQVRGIVHCFSGTHEQAKLFLKKGFYISFSGVLTFQNAKDLQKTAALIPLNRIVLETDAPYLTPVPFRGQINLPSYLSYTAQKLAEIQKTSYEKIVDQTTKNALNVFGINF